MKIDRQKVYDKYSGHCAYCGCEITIKQMHVDHKEPVRRISKFNHGKDKIVFSGNYEFPERLEFENLMPSCQPCNLFKRDFDLETFRQELSKQVERGRKTSCNFRLSEKYGLIQVTEKPIIFYFEKL